MKKHFKKSLFFLFLAIFPPYLQAAIDPCRIDEFKIKVKEGTEHLAMIIKEDITYTGTITILLPPMSDEEKKQLAPQIKMLDPAAASISPASGVAHDFTKQAIYTVNCKNNKVK